MTERMPALPDAALDAAQRRATEALVAGPRKGVFGPFVALMRSPELLERMQRVGEYLRFESSVPARLNEWAILVTARHFTNQFEWVLHHPLAIKAGVAREAIEALGQRSHPIGMAEDEAIVYTLATELLDTHRVSDATYARAAALLGERGLIDLLGTIGYFAALDLLMNAVGTPPPISEVPTLE